MKKFIFYLNLYLFLSCTSVKPIISPAPIQDDNNATLEKTNIAENAEKMPSKDKIKDEDNSLVSARVPRIDNGKEKQQVPITLNSLLLEAGNMQSKEEKLLFCDVINKNKSMFADISLKVLTQPSSTNASQDFDGEFCAKLEVANGSLQKDILSSLGFVAEYTVKTKDTSTKEYKKLGLKDDIISFIPPVSNFAIDSEIKIYLNPFNNSSLEEEVTLINENIDSDIKAKLCATFVHKVATPNRKLSIAIAILDYEQNGKPVLKDNIVANRLFVKMMRNGFSRTGLAPFEALISAKNSEIVDNAKAFFKNAVEYYIFGKTYIKNVEKDSDGVWKTQIEGILYIWNLKTNKKLFEFKFEHSAKGKNQWEATRNARISLGEELMFNKILYNF